MTLVKCERCQFIKKFGRYIKFEVMQVSFIERDNNLSKIIDIGEKTALCEDCNSELSKLAYDKNL